MSLSRRSFISAAGAGVAAAALGVSPAQSQASPKRLSLQAFSADSERIEALRRGVATMKARPPTDPTSWFWQASVHWVRDDWVDDQETQHPGTVAVLQDGRFWKQCPHDGPFHDFALWHRAYLWHFERILAAAAGDPTLRVPYWPYEHPDHRFFPTIFAEGLPDPGEDPNSPAALARNPLRESLRDGDLMAGKRPLDDAAVDMGPADRESVFFGGSGLGRGSSFGGTANSFGTFEVVPHGQIHNAIGGGGGLMSTPLTAGFDPIFWVHHCNIERLWRRWECRADVSWGDFPDGWLDERPWHFQDVDGTVHNHPRRWYLDDANLGVAFDDADASCVPLSARIPTLVADLGDSPEEVIPAGGDILTEREIAPVLFALSEGGVRMETGRLDERVTLSAEAPVEARLTLSPPPFEAAPLPGLPDGGVMISDESSDLLTRLFGRTVLTLEDISIPDSPSVRYDVHVNPKPEPTPADPSYVGTLNTFMLSMGQSGSGSAIHEGHEGKHGGGRQEFDITTQAARSEGDLRVVVVPLSLYGTTDGTEPPSRSGGVSIGNLVIERAP